MMAMAASSTTGGRRDGVSFAILRLGYEPQLGGTMEFVLLILAAMAGIGGWNYVVTQRFKDRFARAFVEEFKASYPDVAEKVTSGVGAQVAQIVLANKKLLQAIETADKRVSRRGDISGDSYPFFHPD